MSPQLLFYNKVVPLSTESHRDLSIKIDANYSFAATTNSVPIVAAEFASAASEYAIIFTGDTTQGNLLPAVILGVRPEENLFLDDTGQWRGKYIPAFVRRYPFIFSKNEGGSTLTLCIDEEFPGFNQAGTGERLFDDQAQQTDYLQNVVNFVQGYQAQFTPTQAFGQKLIDLDLLEPMKASLKLNSGEEMFLDGFMVVSKDKLKALSGEQLAELMASDYLQLIYSHLHSIQHFSKVADYLSDIQAGE